MKNFKSLSLISALVLFICSCGSDHSKDIIGEWTVSEVSTSNEIPAEHKQAYNESIEEMKASYLLVIKEDSTFEHTISETTNKGKWQLNLENKQLILTYDNGVAEKSNLVELTADKMVTSIEVNDSKNTITFVKKKK